MSTLANYYEQQVFASKILSALHTNQWITMVSHVIKLVDLLRRLPEGTLSPTVKAATMQVETRMQERLSKARNREDFQPEDILLIGILCGQALGRV